MAELTKTELKDLTDLTLYDNTGKEVEASAINALVKAMIESGRLALEPVILQQGQAVMNASGDYGLVLGISTPISAPKMIVLGDLSDFASPPTTGVLNNMILGGASIGLKDILLVHQNKDDDITSNISLGSSGARMNMNTPTSEIKMEALYDHLYLLAKSGDGSSAILATARNEVDDKECVQSIWSTERKSEISEEGQIVASDILNKDSWQIRLKNALGDLVAGLDLDEYGLRLANNASGNIFDIRKDDGLIRIVVGPSTLNVSESAIYTSGPQLQLESQQTRLASQNTLQINSYDSDVAITAKNYISIHGRNFLEIYENAFITLSDTIIFTAADYGLGIDYFVYCVTGKLFCTDSNFGAGTKKKAVYELKNYFKYVSGTFTSIGTPELIEIYNDGIVASASWDFNSGYGPILKVAREAAISTDLDFKLSLEIEYL